MPNGQPTPNGSTAPNEQPAPSGRDALVAAVIAEWDAFMQAVAGLHAPGILDVTVTMPQAKVLQILMAEGPLGVTTIAARLGVSASTGSEHIDRLVEHGLVERRQAPTDRRQLLVSVTDVGREAVDRFQELGRRSLAELLASLDDDGLATVRRAVALLADATARQVRLQHRKDATS